MVVFPNAKLNLGLQIVGKRADGYHLLDTSFFPIPLRDILEIKVGESSTDRLSLYGGIDTGTTDDNLVLRAVRLLRRYGYQIPPLDIYLMKHIPSGAGMGGGSADASFALLAINEELNLGLEQGELSKLALELGADCPFFIHNKPCSATGVGEILSPMDGFSLSGYGLLLIKPNLHISTAEAFRGLNGIITEREYSVREILLSVPIDSWKDCLLNDFEKSLFPSYPVLAQLKDWMYQSGAVYASMTGSGATIFGLFTPDILIPLSLPPFLSEDKCFYWQTIL